MLAAFVLRFLIIFSLGVLAFVTFLVATTLIWLMWFDSWRCGACLSYPVGIYTLALLGLLLLGSIGIEAGEASPVFASYAENVRGWFIANWLALVIAVIAVLAILLVLNWWWIADWWCDYWYSPPAPPTPPARPTPW